MRGVGRSIHDSVRGRSVAVAVAVAVLVVGGGSAAPLPPRTSFLPAVLACLLACLLARLHAGSPPSFLARAALLFFDFCDGAVNDTAAPNSSPLLRNYGSLPMRFATAWHSTEGE